MDRTSKIGLEMTRLDRRGWDQIVSDWIRHDLIGQNRIKQKITGRQD